MVKHEKLSTIDPWLQPYSAQLQQRVDHVDKVRRQLLDGSTLMDFANGHQAFGLHRTSTGWRFLEWAPNATALYLVGDFSDWRDIDAFKLSLQSDGEWLFTSDDPNTFNHLDRYKLHMYWDGGDDYRIPAWADRVVQDERKHVFDAQVWNPPTSYIWQHDSPAVRPVVPLIYEAHIGMSGMQESVASYNDFTREVLPRIKAGGYNVIQLMAIQEHPYYGSFGYHVSSYFAASSRFGTPEDLKQLVDTAHGMGLSVILDVVHSHAVKNENEGLSKFDGTTDQYFHSGDRGDHPAWDSRVFDYSKPQVLKFLLSNCRYWLNEYRFDGYRFDGVTSMIYDHHGLEKSFDDYDSYFHDTDIDAITYLTLANELIHTINPSAITIAEDMSALPGIAGPIADGGVGFDYRLSMGVPDMWIKLIKEVRDEDWQVGELYHQLFQHRPEEKIISYAESHDQALVGDKTIIFRLIDKDMYDHMLIDDSNLGVDRGIALHKMIRLLTAATHHGGYLNFMGNEFGHPEWIDFPREGNEWSYKYARRQWNLADDPRLRYRQLGSFDVAMTKILPGVTAEPSYVTINDDDHILAFTRDDLLFVFNFHPSESYTDYGIIAPDGDYDIIISSDSSEYGGFDRIHTDSVYPVNPTGMVQLYLPARTALVLSKNK